MSLLISTPLQNYLFSPCHFDKWKVEKQEALTRSLVDTSSLTTLSDSRCFLNANELNAVKYLLKELIRECCGKNPERAVKLFLTATKKVPPHNL
uniref:Ras-GEF domain-containing protein n=1 Tax=Strongyloides venezuelensis TaxID=75913 RepID=A0A0K0G5X7_STRVS